MRKKIYILLTAVMLMCILSLPSFAAESITIEITDAGIPAVMSGTGWNYDNSTNTIVLSRGYDFTFTGYPCTAIVSNYGTIVQGTFNSKVNNSGTTQILNDIGGTIAGGVYNGEVVNGHGWNTCTINDGVFNGKVVNNSHGVINNGTFSGEVISNFGSNVNGGTYKLVFVTNGGNWAVDYTIPTTYTYGSNLALPTADNISMSGYIFDGWYTRSDFSGQPVTAVPSNASGISTYYAKFTKDLPTWKTIGDSAVINVDYTVDENGNYTVLTAAGLAKIANIINGGDSLSGKTVILENNIDLLTASLEGYNALSVTERNSWIPIDGFAGTFDGNYKKIENLYIQSADANAGLFGTNLGTIQNLELASGKICIDVKTLKAPNNCSIGTIAAVNAGIIQNCSNRLTVESNHTGQHNATNVYVGGMVGLLDTAGDMPISQIVNCVNYGDIISNGGKSLNVYGGGIVGYSFGGMINGHGSFVEDCTNNGKVSVTGCMTARAGGIAGYANSTASVGTTIQTCKNTGAIEGNGSYCMVGGIVGYNYTRSYVLNCYNTASVTGNQNVGGISGYSRASLKNCYNIGTVIASGANVKKGAVVGNKNGGTVSNCYYLDNNSVVFGGINGTDSAGAAEAKNALQFESGEITYLLNESADTGLLVWGQDLKTDTADPEYDLYPVFGGKIVYLDDAVYTNQAPPVPVTGVELSMTSAVLTVGENITLFVSVIPDNATDKNVIWTSSNETIAKVENGVITAVAEGQAIITVTTADGEKTASCAVIVNPIPITTYSVFVNNGTASHTRAASGVSVEIVANPPESGKIFDKWVIDSGNVAFDVTQSAVTFIMPANDVVITATYKADSSNNDWYWFLLMLMNQEFDITATATDGGTITPDGVSKVKYSKDLTYTIIPDEGYAIADVIVDGKSVGAVSVYTFDNVRKDHEITAIFAEIPWENPYSDVSVSDWFYEDVKFVTENGLMNGTVENEIFAPDLTATRAMIVTILWRLEGEPVLDYLMQFEDVPQDEWYSEAVRWAAANGIVLGYDGLFNPENPITREQLAAILHRYAAYKGVDNGVIFPMIPQYDYSEWAENDVIWADMNGLLDGIGNDMTDMTADASRAEVAAILRRFCERFATE